jgi:alpha-L-fucosidase
MIAMRVETPARWRRILRMCVMRHFLRSASFAAVLAGVLPAAAAPAPAPAVGQLQADFRKLEFGMFLHYNMATYHGVQWVEGYPSPATFAPGGPVDTDAWAAAAQSAGMTYGVLTAKHVAGFCLWDSKHTTYDVMHPDCPVKEDLFLLNVGPDRRGRIVDSSIKALAEIPVLRRKQP